MILRCLLLLLSSSVAYAQQGEPLDKLILMSGLDAVVISYPEQLKMQFERVGVSAPDDKSRQMAQQRLLETYAKTDVAVLLRSYAEAELSTNDIKSIFAWFESPLGRRLVQAEQQAGTAAGRQAMAAYMNTLDKDAVNPVRMTLVEAFEAVARLTDINMSMIKVMLESELLAVNAMLPASERQSSDQLSKVMGQQFYDMREMIMPGLMMRMVSVSYYVLSGFTNDEVQAYISFLKSNAGRKLVAMYGRVPVYVFGQIVRRSGIDVVNGFLGLP